MPRPARPQRKVFVTRARSIAPRSKGMCAAAAITVWRDEIPPPASALQSALADADAMLLTGVYVVPLGINRETVRSSAIAWKIWFRVAVDRASEAQERS